MIENFTEVSQITVNNNATNAAIAKSDGVNTEYKTTITAQNNNLMDKNRIHLQQQQAIVDKQKIFLTRSRMLQVARDKNAYKTKIIYTLLAIILFIFTASLGVYVLLKKSKK